MVTVSGKWLLPSLMGMAVSAILCVVSPASAVDYVRECTLFGAGWYYAPGTAVCVNADTGETRETTSDGVVSGETELLHDVRSAREGVALGIAMQNASVDTGKSFGAAINWGVYEGEAAIAASGAVRIGDGLTVNGTLGFGLGEHNVAARAGVNYAW